MQKIATWLVLLPITLEIMILSTYFWAPEFYGGDTGGIGWTNFIIILPTTLLLTFIGLMIKGYGLYNGTVVWEKNKVMYFLVILVILGYLMVN